MVFRKIRSDWTFSIYASKYFVKILAYFQTSWHYSTTWGSLSTSYSIFDVWLNFTYSEAAFCVFLFLFVSIQTNLTLGSYLDHIHVLFVCFVVLVMLCGLSLLTTPFVTSFSLYTGSKSSCLFTEIYTFLFFLCTDWTTSHSFSCYCGHMTGF